MDEKLFITCPKCNKVMRLLRVTAGATVLHTVKGVIKQQKYARLSTHTVVGGEFAGYQCAKCRAILATDSDTLMELIDKHGQMLMSD